MVINFKNLYCWPKNADEGDYSNWILGNFDKNHSWWWFWLILKKGWINIKNNYRHLSTERNNHVHFKSIWFFLNAENLNEIAAKTCYGHLSYRWWAMLCNTEGKMFQHKYCFKQKFPYDFVDIPNIFYISLYIHVALSSGPRAIL